VRVCDYCYAETIKIKAGVGKREEKVARTFSSQETADKNVDGTSSSQKEKIPTAPSIDALLAQSDSSSPNKEEELLSKNWKRIPLSKKHSVPMTPFLASDKGPKENRKLRRILSESSQPKELEEDDDISEVEELVGKMVLMAELEKQSEANPEWFPEEDVNEPEEELLDSRAVVLSGPTDISRASMSLSFSSADIFSLLRKNDPSDSVDDILESIDGEKMQKDLLDKISDAYLVKVVEDLVCREALSKEWIEVILNFARLVCKNVVVDIKAGDHMDICNYVKIKKIPEGTIRGCAYIEGVVCTKNVAHKKMSSFIKNPKILMLSSSLEFQRTARFSSFDSLIQQEKEHLNLIVKKISSLSPQVVVVEKTVSRLALESLLVAGITLVLNVKPTLMHCISRFINCDILPSTDDIMEETAGATLGHCGGFYVKTYKGSWGRKTLLFMEGCPKNLGCSILLRGAPSPVLVKVKRALLFAIRVAYNLHLESALFHDICAIPLPVPDSEAGLPEDDGTEDLKDSKEEEQGALLSSSSGVVYPAPPISDTPYSLCLSVDTVKSSMQNSCDGLTALGKGFDYTLLFKLNSENGENIGSRKDESGTPSKRLSSQSLSNSPSKRSSMSHSTPAKRLSNSLTSSQKGLSNSLTSSQMGLSNSLSGLPKPPKSSKRKYTSVKTLNWKGYNEQQQIVCMHSLVCVTTGNHCMPFKQQVINYYSDNDFTVGEFFEMYCLNPDYVCPNENCHLPMKDHARAFIHDSGRINITVHELNLPNHSTDQVQILNFCKLCGKATPFVSISEETWRYSFGKFLELTFYNKNIKSNIEGCSHSVHTDHVRYIFKKNMVVHMEFEPVLTRVVVPPNFELEHDPERTAPILAAEIQNISHSAQQIYDVLHGQLKQLEPSLTKPLDKQRIRKMLTAQQTERSNFFQQLSVIKKMNKILPAHALKRSFYENVQQWSKSYDAMAAKASSPPVLQPILKKEESTLRVSLLKEVPQLGQSPPTQEMGLVAQDDSLLVSFDEYCPFVISSHESRDILELTDSDDEFDLPSLSSSPNFSHSFPSFDNMDIYVAGDDLLEEFVKIGDMSEEPHAQENKIVTKNTESKANGIAENKVNNQIESSENKSNGEHQANCTEKTVNTNDHTREQTGIKNEILAQEAVRQKSTDNNNKPDNKPENNTASKNSANTAEDTTKNKNDVVKSQNSQHIAKNFPLNIPKLVTDNKNKNKIKQKTQANSRSANNSPRREQNNGINILLSNGKGNNNYVINVNNNQTNDKKILETIEEKARSIRHIPAEIRKETSKEKRRNSHRRSTSLTLVHPNEPPRSLSMVIEKNNLMSFAKTMSDRTSILVSRDRTDRNSGYAIHSERPTTTERKLVLGRDRSSTDSQVSFKTSDRVSLQEDLRAATDEVFFAASNSPVFSRRTDEKRATQEEQEQQKPVRASSTVKGSFMSTISHLLSTNPDDIQSEEMTLVEKLNSGIFFPVGVNDTVVIVNKLELASVIAYTLSSKKYDQKFQKISRLAPSDINKLRKRRKMGETSVEDMILSDAKTHIKTKYMQKVLGGDKEEGFVCITYFAQQFTGLRSLCCGGEDNFIESMCRCKNWHATGGKSGSPFSKTLDDRYVVKQVSRIELMSFLAFASQYFEYLSSSYFCNIPTCLAKIVGLYSIQWRSSNVVSKTMKHLVVMENLFYKQNIKQTFDLKGSMRSRYVEKEEDKVVLMDENLLESLFDNPLCISESSKILLSMAVWNDSLLLSSLGVMDYSLLVGINESEELVIGIIDYMRKYTWDKAVEHWAKAAGILGGRGKVPTVIAPKLYKARFRDAMWLYFVMVPNKYTNVTNKKRKN